MNKQPTLKLWPVLGINMFKLPKQYADSLRHCANEEDCIPYRKQDSVVTNESYRELESVDKCQSTVNSVLRSVSSNFGNNIISMFPIR